MPALGGAIYCSVLTLDHASEPVYAVPTWAVAVTVILLCLAVVGCGFVVWSRQPLFGAVVLAGTALGVLGFLAILSFGVLALMLASGLLFWVASGRWSGAGRLQSAVGAVLAGASLPLLVIFAMAGPLVDCDTDGVTSGENLFLGLKSAGGSGMSSSGAEGAFMGRVDGGAYHYSYVCRDGRLVQFDLRWR